MAYDIRNERRKELDRWNAGGSRGTVPPRRYAAPARRTPASAMARVAWISSEVNSISTRSTSVGVPITVASPSEGFQITRDRFALATWLSSCTFSVGYGL